jgi:hypothetical protein
MITDAQIDAMLDKLDDYIFEIDPDYGIPMIPVHIPGMRAIVREMLEQPLERGTEQETNPKG